MMTNNDEYAHEGMNDEEWTFSWWSKDASMAGYSSYRLVGATNAWYCWGLWRQDEPLLHVVECDIPRRSDPMIAKAPALWAEYTCDAPYEQWTLGQETFAVELDDPSEALGRVYGTVVPIASDLEWCAHGDIELISDGYQQKGVLLGSVETAQGRLEINEVHARRSHRWSGEALREIDHVPVLDHLGPRIPFKLPNGIVRDLVLTPSGFSCGA